MTPQDAPRSGQQHRGMEPSDADQLEAFNARIRAFLDDEAPGLAEAETMYHAASAYGATQRAIEAAASHTTCSPDERTDTDILVQVVGEDGLPTIQRLHPGVSVGCVLVALAQDHTVLHAGVMGWDHYDEGPEPVTTEAGGMAVTSENPDVVATYEGDIEPPA